MLKKVTAIAFAFLSIFFLWVANSKPIFNGYANQFEIYQNNNSSSAQIINVSKNNLWLYSARYGEACVVSIDDFDEKKFFQDFKATVIKTERTEDGTSFYAYSPKIKYCKNVNGKKINLHLFVGNTTVKMGSPLIYGSY